MFGVSLVALKDSRGLVAPGAATEGGLCPSSLLATCPLLARPDAVSIFEHVFFLSVDTIEDDLTLLSKRHDTAVFGSITATI